MTTLLDLMNDPNGRALTPKEREKALREAAKLKPRKTGHAWRPGSGPAGETCKTCKHYTLRRFAKTYRKCGLMQAHWTGGPGTDIKASDPACLKWKAAE